MKKILYFCLILNLVLPLYIYSVDEQEAFTDTSSVTPGDIFAGDVQPTPDPNTPMDGSMTNAMSSDSPAIDNGEPTVQATGGIQAKDSAIKTPTPVPQGESMFKSNETNIQEANKTKEEIEKDVNALYKEGRKYYDIEDYDGASEIWERIIQNYPTAKNLYDIRYSLANAYEYSKQYDKAITQYQKVLAEKPKAEISIEAAYRLAGCYSKLEKWAYAVEIYKDMITKKPDKADTIRAYMSLAQVYMKQEKYKRVEIIYKNIIKYFPNSQWEIQARFQLASLYAQTNRYKSAVKEYKLIKFKFKDTEWAPRAAMHIGDTYKLAGQYKDAKEAYSRVIYEYYMQDMYVQQAEERIKGLKTQREIEYKVYGQ